MIQVSKTDAFPKFVCSDCWQKTETFHEFHRSVKRAQENYLKQVVKHEQEEPNIRERDFDCFEYFDDDTFQAELEQELEQQLDLDKEHELVTEIISERESDHELEIKNDLISEYDEHSEGNGEIFPSLDDIPNIESNSDEEKWGKNYLYDALKLYKN